MNYIDTIIWIIIFVLAIVLESITNTNVILWFIAGSFFAFVSTFFIESATWQFVIFVVTSGVLMLLFYKKIKDKTRNIHEKTNTDLLIGRNVPVIKAISKDNNGLVKIGDVTWTAKSDETLQTSELANIVSISGNTLTVKKQ